MVGNGHTILVKVGGKSLRISQVAYQADAYSGFYSTRRLGVFLLPPRLDAVYRRVNPPFPSIKFVGTHLYTWMERGTVRVKCLSQKHSTMSSARVKT